VIQQLDLAVMSALASSAGMLGSDSDGSAIPLGCWCVTMISVAFRLKRTLHDPARVHDCTIDSPAKHRFGVQHLVVGVQKHDAEALVIEGCPRRHGPLEPGKS
jgi:hypothetical protein